MIVLQTNKTKKGGPHYLECDCELFARQEWCDHLRVFIQNEKDGTFLLAKLPTLRIKVPFMIDPRLNIICDLVNSDDGFRKVLVRKSLSPKDDGYLIGWMLPTDGIKIIRRLILEWLIAIQFSEKLHCNASFHQIGDSVLEQFLYKNYPLYKLCLQDTFYLYTTGICTQCRIATDLPSVSPTFDFSKGKENR